MELSFPEGRVLGCLIEKERSTPQNYPLTLNALRLACNQSSNRDPIVDLDDLTIEQALTSLREQGLTRIVYSTTNRAAKYRHVVHEALHFTDEELSVLAVLLLRGPQTVGEIKGRTERMFPFADLQAVQNTLDRLASRYEEPYVVHLERRPGQKDARWAHLLSGEVVEEPPARVASWPSPSRSANPLDPSPAPRPSVPNPAPDPGPDRSAELAAEVAELRRELEALRAEFDAFRAEFG